MSATTCPNCGKSLRAGARFCGNCGHTLPAAPRQAAPPPRSEARCPHCGKPVREGARFCSNCGKPFDAPVLAELPPAPPAETVGEATRQTPPFTAATAVTVRHPETPAPSSGVDVYPASPVTAMQSGPALSPTSPPRSRPATSSGSGRWAIWLAAAALAGCAILAVGGYFLAGQMGWLPGLPRVAGTGPTQTGQPDASPTGVVDVAVLPSATVTIPTAQPPATATLLPVATTINAVTSTSIPTPSIPTPSMASTSEPVAVATGFTPPSSTSTPDAAASPAEPLTGTLPAGAILFDENFDNGLTTYWRSWGNPRPTIDSGPGDNWLYLKDIDPGGGGVTTRNTYPIFNSPGAVYEFQAQLDFNYPIGMIAFDWDPPTYDRGPDNRDPGLIHLEIYNKSLKLQAPLTREECTQEIRGVDMHTYTLRMLEDQAVELYVDGDPTFICRIEFMGLAPVPGSLSFTGLGWVTRVTVTQP